MILVDRQFLTDIGIIEGGETCGTFVDFYRGLVMSSETILTFRRFYEVATIGGVNYKNKVEFYKQIGIFYSEPEIKNEVTFMRNATFDGVNPIGDFVTFYKGVCALLDEPTVIHYSIQGYDTQATNELNNTTLANFDRTDSFSVAFRFRYDIATFNREPNTTIFIGNRTAAGRGWQIAHEPASNKWRFRFSNAGGNEDIVRFQAASGLVVDNVYEVLFTHDSAGNYGCIINGDVLTPSVDTNTLTGTTVSTNPVSLGITEGLSTNFIYYGMFNDVMFCNKVLSQSEFNEYRNSQSTLKDYTTLSYNANIDGYFHANDAGVDATIMKFPNQVNSAEWFGAADSRDYFKLPYDIYNYNPTTTYNVTNYVNNPILNGTSDSTTESYVGDMLLDDDNTIVSCCKAQDSVTGDVRIYIFRGNDVDSLIEVNKLIFPLANFPVDEIGSIRIRKEGLNYHFIVRRQVNGSIGGSGLRDICVLTTTDITTSIQTWTQTLGMITPSMIPFESSGTGNWGLMTPSDLFKYQGKYYFIAICGNLLDYAMLFESDSMLSGYSYVKTLFSVNEARWLNTLRNDNDINLVQGCSVIKEGNKYRCVVTIGSESNDTPNERYIIAGEGSTPFDFEFKKTVLHQSGALNTYSERRVYDSIFWKKNDGEWLEPEVYSGKNWISYAGHSLNSSIGQPWQSEGKLSLISFPTTGLTS